MRVSCEEGFCKSSVVIRDPCQGAIRLYIRSFDHGSCGAGRFFPELSEAIAVGCSSVFSGFWEGQMQYANNMCVSIHTHTCIYIPAQKCMSMSMYKHAHIVV